jgi:hypothetical protein
VAKSPLVRGFFQQKLTAAKKSANLMTWKRKGRCYIGQTIEYVIYKYLKANQHALPVCRFENA